MFWIRGSMDLRIRGSLDLCPSELSAEIFCLFEENKRLKAHFSIISQSVFISFTVRRLVTLRRLVILVILVILVTLRRRINKLELRRSEEPGDVLGSHCKDL